MSDDFDARVADLNAQREQIALRRQQRADEEERVQKLAEAERALRDEEAVDAAEQEHGAKKIAVVQTDLGVVIVKRPHVATFRKFQDKGSTDSESLEKLVRPCLVYPKLPEFELICSELPATLLRVANAVTMLAGVRTEELAGKS